jgi:hypothetical protein
MPHFLFSYRSEPTNTAPRQKAVTAAVKKKKAPKKLLSPAEKISNISLACIVSQVPGLHNIVFLPRNSTLCRAFVRKGRQLIPPKSRVFQW